MLEDVCKKPLCLRCADGDTCSCIDTSLTHLGCAQGQHFQMIPEVVVEISHSVNLMKLCKQVQANSLLPMSL